MILTPDTRHLTPFFHLIWILFFVLICGASAAFGDQDGYLKVDGPCDFEFPKDHGAHPGFRTEWWYYTGNLRTAGDRRFGFQLAFFRRQISPINSETNWPQRPSAWRTRQIYLAHAAVSDISGKSHRHAEQIARQALDLSGVSLAGQSVKIFLKNWFAAIHPGVHRLQADSGSFSFMLDLFPSKAPVAHGNAGYSLKGKSPERASCYYSLTRLKARGTLTLDGISHAVKGQAWMDHEYSTAPLEPDLVGWDWFSLQLSDQTEIMIFLLREKDGGLADASSGTLVDAEGRSRHLDKHDFTIDVLQTWKSPDSKADYPSRWRIQILPRSLSLTVSANLADQEMRMTDVTGITYWEGSVAVEGGARHPSLRGEGYVEMTGYVRAFDRPL